MINIDLSPDGSMQYFLIVKFYLNKQILYNFLREVIKIKITKRKLQAIKTKKRIMETALPMIKERGFDNVSVDEICSAAGIAKGTFYHYFPSKEKIFGQTGIMMDDIALDNLLTDDEIPTIDKITHIVEAYMELAVSQGVDITRQLFKSFIDGNDIYNPETSGTQILEQIAAEGIAKKEINPKYTTQDVIDLVFAFTSGLILYWLNSNNAYDLKEKSNNLLEKWLRKTLANEE